MHYLTHPRVDIYISDNPLTSCSTEGYSSLTVEGPKALCQKTTSYILHSALNRVYVIL